MSSRRSKFESKVNITAPKAVFEIVDDYANGHYVNAFYKLEEFLKTPAAVKVKDLILEKLGGIESLLLCIKYMLLDGISVFFNILTN